MMKFINKCEYTGTRIILTTEETTLESVLEDFCNFLKSSGFSYVKELEAIRWKECDHDTAKESN